MKSLFFPFRFRHWLVVLLLSIFPIFAAQGWAAVYYIDYTGGNDANNGTSKSTPWKRCPGMVGFAGSYSHSAGDQFIFKGGVTWTGVFPWTIGYSGSAGNVDTYTTDRTWYTGGSWSQPVFNFQSSGAEQIVADSRSYLTFNDLKFINNNTCGAPMNKTMQFTDCQQITINGCTFIDYAWISIYFAFTSSGTYSNINVTNNDVSTSSAMAWFGIASGTVTVNGVNLAGNLVHDGTCSVANDTHVDGIAHFYGVPTFNPNHIFTNVVVAYNRVYGNWAKYDGSSAGWTAFLYNEAVSSAKIYNNVIAPNAVGGFIGEAMLMFSATGASTVEMYNNTVVVAGAANTVTAAIKGGAYGSGSTAIFRGNLVYGSTNSAYYYTGGGTLNSNYNCYSGKINYNPSGSSDANSVRSSLLLVNPPTDNTLQSNSSCKDAFPTAQAPSGTFTTDYLGYSRPAGPAWDMGAYESGSQVPSPPAALRIIP